MNLQENLEMLEDLTINDLDSDQRTLAECIGMNAYKKLIENYAGSFVYVRKLDTVTNSVRNANILKEFNGYNYKALAKKYGLSVVSIRRIINSAPPEKRRRTSKKVSRPGS